MTKRIRYQGAILRDDHVLLIKHRNHGDGRAYWVVPGGGRENGESEEACVAREMKEETHLDVIVERLLFEDGIDDNEAYRSAKTYLCRVAAGEAKPGYEPEIEASQNYGIVEVRWFDLRRPETWDALLLADEITLPWMRRVREKLGYEVG
jgi:ADP-ribose pyrophosphatase YjhB (NUDIX family)